MRTKCLLAATVGLLIAILPGRATAQVPDECFVMAMQIGTETNSKFARKSDTSVFFNPPLQMTRSLTNELSIMCGTEAFEKRTQWSVFLHWGQSISPPDAFYKVIGRAGAILTGDTESSIVKASKECLQNARKDDGNEGSVATGKAQVECIALPIDGGLAEVTIFMPRNVKGK